MIFLIVCTQFVTASLLTITPRVSCSSFKDWRDDLIIFLPEMSTCIRDQQSHISQRNCLSNAQSPSSTPQHHSNLYVTRPNSGIIFPHHCPFHSFPPFCMLYKSFHGPGVVPVGPGVNPLGPGVNPVPPNIVPNPFCSLTVLF